MLVGLHVEGNDDLIFRCLVARLLGCEEREIETDRIDAPDHGFESTLRLIPAALARFYAKDARLVVVAVDNDGDPPARADSTANDPRRPRHWTHAGRHDDACRWCRVDAIVTAARRKLTWGRPAERWPVVIAVPVEAIEAWLLVCQGLRDGRGDLLRAEGMPRGTLKQRFYGRPAAIREDVENKALPLLRALGDGEVAALGEYAHSFALFAEQVTRQRDAVFARED